MNEEKNQMKAIAFETLMEEAIKKFLEETGFDDKAWVVSLKCYHCNILCTAFTNDTRMFFKCDKCKHVWELKTRPLGYDKKSIEEETSK